MPELDWADVENNKVAVCRILRVRPQLEYRLLVNVDLGEVKFVLVEGSRHSLHRVRGTAALGSVDLQTNKNDLKKIEFENSHQRRHLKKFFSNTYLNK